MARAIFRLGEFNSVSKGGKEPLRSDRSFLSRSLGWLIGGIWVVCQIVLIAWGTLAICYSNLPWAALRLTLAAAFAAFAVWACWVSPRRGMSAVFLGRPVVAIFARAPIQFQPPKPPMLARPPSDVLDNLLSRFLQWSGLLSHLRSYECYDEPETLPYSIRPFCPMSADGGQWAQVIC